MGWIGGAAAAEGCVVTKIYPTFSGSTAALASKIDGITLTVQRIVEKRDLVEVPATIADESACLAWVLTQAKGLKPHETLEWSHDGKGVESVNAKSTADDLLSHKPAAMGHDYQPCIAFMTDDKDRIVEESAKTGRPAMYTTFVEDAHASERCADHARKVLAAKTAKYPDKVLRMNFFVDDAGSYAKADYFFVEGETVLSR